MRWMLLLFICVSLPTLADPDYALKPRQIAEDTWLLEGSTDNFAKNNGGNIVNTALRGGGDRHRAIEALRRGPAQSDCHNH
jgi:hypothetical protein